MHAKKLWPLAALVAALAVGWVGLRASTRDEEPRVAARGRSSARSEATPLAAEASDALMLSLAIDHAGARVLQALRKPGLAVRAPRDPEALPFRWTLVSAQGALLAEGAFDPGPVDLDPAHAGEPPIVRGDTITPHVVHANLKVPDLRGQDAVLRLLRRDGAAWIACGEQRLAALEVQ